jgi:hypothetical protein
MQCQLQHFLRGQRLCKKVAAFGASSCSKKSTYAACLNERGEIFEENQS